MTTAILVDGVNFSGLTSREVALKLHRMKGADMLWYSGVLILLVAALMVSAIPALLTVAIQYPFIFMAFNNIEREQQRRFDAWIEAYIASFSVVNSMPDDEVQE